MELGIKGKRALITGASRGIGRAIAIEFAKEGCRVAAIARDEAKLKELVALIGGKGKGHAYYAADLTRKAELEMAMRELGKGGRFDIVVHNLGGTLGIREPLARADDWNRVWQLNVGAAIEINSMLIPHMQRQKWGRVVHISSNAAELLRGSPQYGAAKAYLNAYVKILGRTLAKDGIVVSALMPGPIAKGDGGDEESKSRESLLKQQIPAGRLGTPEEIAAFAVFMASEKVTFSQASIIPIDGGMG